MNKVQVGREAEEKAAKFLELKGYTVLARNYKFMRLGEIDIIARINDTLVFVEVRSRKYRTYGTPEGSLTPKKFRTIRRVAEAWMSHNRYYNRLCRFDVVAVDLFVGCQEIRHYENAF